MSDINPKKNIPDLEYSKYLQYYTTTIIIMFTYLIGTAIAIITKQVDYNNIFYLILLITVSTLTIGLCVLLLFNFKDKMSTAQHEILTLSS